MKKHIKYLPWALGVCLLITGILYVTWGKPLIDRYSSLTGRYMALEEEFTKYRETSLEKVEEREATIERLTHENAELEENIERREADVQRLDTEIKELEDARETLENKDDIIINLEEQVVRWREKFQLSQDIIEIKEGQIFNLTEKYKAQLDISIEYKTLYENERRLRLLGEDRLTVLEKKVKKLSLLERAKNFALLAAGGAIAYNLITK